MSVEGWKTGTLGKLCKIEIGGTPMRDNPEYWDSQKETDNLWVSIRDMNQRVINDTAEYITNIGVKNSNAKLQHEGTILLSFKLTIGRVAFAGKQLYTNEAIAALQTEQLTHNFLYYGLQQWNLLQDVDQAIKGATLNKTKLNKIEFQYPVSLQEQTQIATILSTIDRAIEQTEALIAKQQRIKTGLMQDLLTKGIDENGNIRSEETHEFKDSPLGRIPVEWEVENYSEGCKRVSVGIATSTTKHFKDKGVPLIRNQNVLSGSFSLDDLLFISREFDEINKNKRLKSGDLVTMRTGYPGRTAIADKKMEGWQTFTTLISTPDSNKYLPEFMCILLNSFICRHQILGLQGGGAQQNLNVGWIVGMKIVKPLISEQIKIVKIIQSINEYIDILADSLNKLRCNKTGLMQDLLTGKVRVIELIKERETDNL